MIGTKRERALILAAFAAAEKARGLDEHALAILIDDLMIFCDVRPPSYRPGMQRLVGNAYCNECRTHQPALTCFDVSEDGMSCGWQICDSCLKKALPASEPGTTSTAARDGARFVDMAAVEEALISPVSNAAVVEQLSRLSVPRETLDRPRPQCTGRCNPSLRIFSPFCDLHGPGQPGDPL